jgi:hypothetical protein
MKDKTSALDGWVVCCAEKSLAHGFYFSTLIFCFAEDSKICGRIPPPQSSQFGTGSFFEPGHPSR